LDSDISTYAHGNELEFCSLWSTKYEIRKNINLFYNGNLLDDYFFNRLDVGKSHEFGIIKEIINSISDIGKIYVYCDSADINTLQILEQSDLSLFGRLKSMCLDVTIDKTREIIQNNNITTKIVGLGYLNKWIDTYSKAFLSFDTKDEVCKILTRRANEMILILAYSNTSTIMPAGCCILFEKFGLMGLFCLGTIPNLRNRGVGSELLNTAVIYSKGRNVRSLVLQTLSEENHEKFFLDNGFNIISERVVFSS
jgi:ribosomal protein S18 acetylase RimI-like enzyme